MPKIPQFKSGGQLQIGNSGRIPVTTQSLKQTEILSDVSDIITDFGIKQKTIEDKTEALELENASVIELNSAVQEASKYTNKEKANSYLMNESKRIKTFYESKATSNSVKNLFQNNYLLEEQKQIFKVDNAVYKNTVQKAQDQKELKLSRIYKDYFFADNPLAKDTAYNTLVQIELDDVTQDDATRDNNIALIPRKIDYFTAKQKISKDPIDALKGLLDENQYKNLDVDTLTSLISEAKSGASQGVKDDVLNYFALKRAGKEANINEDSVKLVLGDNYYNEFKEKQSGYERSSYFASRIMTSKLGDGMSIANMFPIRKGSEALDLQLQQELKTLVVEKEKMFNSDPAKLILGYNEIVQEKYNDFLNEEDQEIKKQKFQIYSNSMRETQIEMGGHPLSVKLMTKEEALQNVASITDETKSWKEQKGILDGVVDMYGANNAQTIFDQLSSEKLPFYIRTAMSIDNQNLSESILASGKIKDLENLVKPKLPSQISLQKIKTLIAKDLEKYEDIINSQPEGSVSKEEYILSLRETLYKASLHEINKGENYDTATGNAVKQFLEDYDTSQKTYLIPTNVNGDDVSKEAVINKADRILLSVEQSDYLKRFMGDDFTHYATTLSSAESLPDEIKLSDDKTFNAYVKNRMTDSIKKHSKWLLNGSSTGIVLYVELAGGKILPVQNSKGEKIEFFFTPQKDQNPNIKNSIELVEPGTQKPLVDFDKPTIEDYIKPSEL